VGQGEKGVGSGKRMQEQEGVEMEERDRGGERRERGGYVGG
jgi:hypothetical protein